MFWAIASIVSFFIFIPSSLFAESRPQFEKPQMGLHQTGFSGGGIALPSGVNALFGNPAGLEIRTGEMLETGFLGIAKGFSPYFLFGGRVSEVTNYALGYFSDNRNLPQLQGLIGGFSLSPGNYFTAGISGYGISLEDQYGIDFSAGALYRFGWIKAAISGHDLLESGTGLPPKGWQSKRNFNASLALYPEKNRRIGVFYDLGWEGIPLPESHYQILSLGGFLGHSGNVGVFGSSRLETGVATFGLGIVMDLPVGIHEIGMGYSLNNVPLEASAVQLKRISHSMALRIHFSSNIDILVTFPNDLLERYPKVMILTMSSILSYGREFQIAFYFTSFRIQGKNSQLGGGYLQSRSPWSGNPDCALFQRKRPAPTIHSMAGKRCRWYST